MPDNYWFYIFAFLFLVAVFGYLIWRDWKDRREAEIELDADTLDSALDEYINWTASTAMAIVLIQKDLARIADKLCEGAPTAEVKSEAPEDRKQSLYEEGIQNILNYGMEQMRNRGDGI